MKILHLLYDPSIRPSGAPQDRDGAHLLSLQIKWKFRHFLQRTSGLPVPRAGVHAVNVVSAVFNFYEAQTGIGVGSIKTLDNQPTVVTIDAGTMCPA